MQILLVEDDESLADGMVSALNREGFTVKRVADGKTALACYKTEAPDIIVLDLGLPDMDGLSVLNSIRKKGATIPVLVLTARDSLEAKVKGLDSGADDYLTKPFELGELMARLRVLERRLGTATTSEIVVGPITLDTATHIVTREGEPLALSRREYMVLKALMEHIGAIKTRESIEDKLYSWGDEVASNAVEVHISNLRKKLPQDFIHTVRGIGYMIKKPR